MLKSYESVYNNGKPLSAGSKQMYMNDFHEMLNAGGDNSILSLSFDNVMGMYDADGNPTSLLSKEQYANELNALQRGTPEEKEVARQTLKQALTQSYMNSLETQASEGVKAAGTGNDDKTPVETQKQINDRKRRQRRLEMLGSGAEAVPSFNNELTARLQPNGKYIIVDEKGAPSQVYTGVYSADDPVLKEALNL